MTKTPKALTTKAKIDTWDLIKLEFLHSKRNNHESEPATNRWEKVIEIQPSDKGLISRIYKELKQIYKKRTNPSKVGKGYEQTLFERRHI